MENQFAIMGDGCRIAWRFDGPDDAPVLLLSNSLGTDLSMWEPQLARWSRSYRVLRYDQRGHGASDAPGGGYSMDRLGCDVIELLDRIGLDAVHFCGLSLGGMVGQWLGIRAPQRLRRLILANTSSYMGPPSAWNSRISQVQAEGMAAVVEPSIGRWFTPGFLRTATEQVGRVSGILRKMKPVGYLGCCAAIRDMDMRRTATLISGPVLVIAGSQDSATPVEHSEHIVQSIVGATLEVTEAAHMANVELPERFGQLVGDFLNVA